MFLNVQSWRLRVAVPVADRFRFWVRRQKSLCRRNCSVFVMVEQFSPCIRQVGSVAIINYIKTTRHLLSVTARPWDIFKDEKSNAHACGITCRMDILSHLWDAGVRHLEDLRRPVHGFTARPTFVLSRTPSTIHCHYPVDCVSSHLSLFRSTLPITRDTCTSSHKAPSTPSTMSKQRSALSKESIDLQHLTTLLRHCCWWSHVPPACMPSVEHLSYVVVNRVQTVVDVHAASDARLMNGE